MKARSRHFAIIAPPTPGHLNPLQALGSELIGSGHRVTILHQADVAPLVRHPGIGFEPLAVPVDAAQSLARYNAILAAPTGPGGLTRMIRATAAMSERLLTHGAAALARSGADAVIADSAEPAGALLAQALDLPCVVSVTGLPLLGEPDVPPPFLGWRYRPGALGRFRNGGGYLVADRLMQPVTSVVDRFRSQHGLRQSAPDQRLHVAQCPQGLDYPRKRLPANFHYGSPWRMATPQEIDLPGDRPLIFCSLGSLQGSRLSLFAAMAEACAAVGAQAVIGHGGGLTPAEAASLPGDPLVRALWPQEAVLRRCAAAILHGGFNTVIDALAAGVPIVALPIAFEQPGTAARLAWRGAGETLSLRSVTARSIAGKLKRVLSDSRYRLAAAELSAEMRSAGGAAGAAARIKAAIG